MRTFLRYRIPLHFLTILFCFNCQNETPEKEIPNDKNSSTLFQLLSPQQTGVYFQNTLKEGPNTNVLMYEYFYNGAGVATTDFNGDELIDIYFTSNMGDNKLYLNKGEMQFEEVTQASGATGRPGPWKTGVTSVDINGDGRQDIFISYSGALPNPKRKNQLYINKGNNEDGIPLFKDEAEKYGLASEAYSNQAYFFDYDKDGDLDMLLLNHNPKSMPILDEVKTAEIIKKEDPSVGIRLLQQTNGVFKDVTLQAGISSSSLTYGLGIAISDIDHDGWPDFYVCNDYSVPDYFYFNNQDGTFTDRIHKSLNHTSLTSMGNDIADLNNDGWTDIISMDMLPEGNQRQKLLMNENNYEKFDLNIRSGFHQQYMRNMLQLNNGNGTFSEIGQLAGVSNTDWSWAVLAADYDNDGWKDLYVTNGYYRDFTNMDFINYMNDFVSRSVKLKRSDVLELSKKIPTTDVVNYMFENQGGITFSNATSAWGMDQPANSNGAAYADLDNDGDLDMVVNNVNKAAFIYENTANKKSGNQYLKIKLIGEGMNTQGIGTKVSIYSNGKSQLQEQYNSRGYLSGVTNILHFGLGADSIIDSLIVTWNSGHIQKLTNISVNQQITLHEKDAHQLEEQEPMEVKPIFHQVKSPINYQHPELQKRDFDRQPLLISELSTSGPCMVKGDVNGDGLEDLFIGGAKGQSAVLYLQSERGEFIAKNVNAFTLDKESEDTDAAIFDANGDGFNDLYVTSGGYHDFKPDDPLLQDRFYINDGKGNFEKRKDALPPMLTSTGSVTSGDFNKDGYLDLFVGGRLIPGRYPETPNSYLLINDGRGRFTDQTDAFAPELRKIGMVTDAVWMDINHDKSLDLLIVGEWMPVSVFINDQSKLVNRTLDYFESEFSGWWNVIETTDFNGDNKPDLLIGNCGENIQFQASKEEPAEQYFSDFDNNGTVDPIFTYYIRGKSYPYLTKEELINQLPQLGSRFSTYESYSNAQVTDIFKKEQLDKARHLSANHMETTVFLSQPDGKYKPNPLPVQAQFAPVYSVLVIDYDEDGNSDLLLFGNNSHLKLRLGNIDANYGVLLKGNGRGEFQYIDQLHSGFKLRGDVRSNVLMGSRILFGMNQGKIITYEMRE